MKQSQTSHLPVMGVGPIYVISIVINTIFAIISVTQIRRPPSTSKPLTLQSPTQPFQISLQSPTPHPQALSQSRKSSLSRLPFRPTPQSPLSSPSLAYSSSYSVSSSMSSPSKSKSPKPSKRTGSSLLAPTPLFATPSTLPGSSSVLVLSFSPVRFF